ncbi:MAG: type II RES/Xre toxin-antitoxin system antitoxin [Hafnia alvei]|uniref:DUF2384 domain-containing protein n=1 Tax=Hafnia alvei TaxID=569 RepID=A0A1C6YX80_HAFAL|nr:antitoxin Xre/MbcA/ParS toxin-binding domain-containing protein [Hafnia alvei]MDN5969270.1 DUF2384 domain-containing protein [Enterobacterales bacterium]NEY28597.1 DUF2384 domain-containing protein [Escherichia coli]KAA0262738.1 DUF2384 domain-containing protein [Hafnia alvei]KID02078.1 toxin-antitoxin system antitoxin component [Hafnia alvei]MBI0278431.1 DUF2384 domain-containing protein [Hafnia alvei]
MRMFTPTQQRDESTLWRVVSFPPEGSIQLLELLKQGLPTDVIENIHQWTGINKADIVQIAGISGRQVSRRKNGPKTLSPEQSESIARLVRVMNAAIALFEDDKEQAIHWLTHPVRALGQTAPASLISTESGAIAVLNLIGRLEHGVFS